MYLFAGKTFDELYDYYDAGFNFDVDPTITNSFATAAFHFVNSLLDENIQFIAEDNTVMSYRLHEHYYKPAFVTQKRGLEKILRGMTTQKSQEMDLNYEDDVSFFFHLYYLR